MKKELIALVLATTVLSVPACSQGVSKTNYESVVAEKESLEAEKASMESSIAVEKLDRESKKLTDSQPLVIAQSWASVAFGDTAVFSDADNQYLQCIVLSPKESSVESLKAIQNSMRDAIITLNTLTSSITVKYKYIYIRFLNQKNTPLIEYVLENKGTSYDVVTFTLDMGDTETLQNFLDFANSN